MLDRKTLKLLRITNNLCKDESYKVVDIPVFLNGFKKRDKVNQQQLNVMLYDLQKNDYIDIKYSDDSVFCLAIKTKGRNYTQKEVNEYKQIKKIKRLFAFYVFLAGVFAFLGATIAIILFK